MEPSESEKLLLQLYEDVWNFKMELSPLGATMYWTFKCRIADHRFDDKVEDLSRNNYDRTKKAIETFLEKAQELRGKVPSTQELNLDFLILNF